MKHYPNVFKKLESLGAWYGSIGIPCEPGYDEKLSLYGNWNNISHELESALSEHYELEWEDEWLQCGYCGKFFRTSPDCYQWTMYGETGDGDWSCGDCVKAAPDGTIEDCLNNAHRCLPSFLNPSDYGFQNMNGTFENGFFNGMNDRPEEILKAYQEKYPTYEFVFGNLESSQFYVTFEIWGRPI